jgi:hypothetical protein
VKPVIAVVGAFDRFNFGDLLFPHMVRFGFEKLGVDAEYRHLSLRAADLRDRGGVVTAPFASLKTANLPQGSLVVVAGGEMLSARWLDAFAGLAGPRRTLAVKMLARTIGAAPVDRLCRRLLGGDRPLPWVLDAGDLGHDGPVSYNAVGGIGVGRLPKPLREEARIRLHSAAYIGVRDPETKADLERWDLPVEVNLTPDSAVLAPEAFPLAELLPTASETTRAVLSRLGPDYLVLQVGRYPAWGRVPVLADQIRKIHRETGFGILLLPLGQAAGHEDRAPLEKIGGLLEDLPVELLPQPDVNDILISIANARLFVGSSLHGNLMALVYGVPHVGFGERVPKLDLMMRTWDPAAPEGAAVPGEIAKQALRAVNERHADFEAAIRALQGAATTAIERQAQLVS